jgi:hypothetical protein
MKTEWDSIDGAEALLADGNRELVHLKELPAFIHADKALGAKLGFSAAPYINPDGEQPFSCQAEYILYDAYAGCKCFYARKGRMRWFIAVRPPSYPGQTYTPKAIAIDMKGRRIDDIAFMEWLTNHGFSDVMQNVLKTTESRYLNSLARERWIASAINIEEADIIPHMLKLKSIRMPMGHRDDYRRHDIDLAFVFDRDQCPFWEEAQKAFVAAFKNKYTERVNMLPINDAEKTELMHMLHINDAWNGLVDFREKDEGRARLMMQRLRRNMELQRLRWGTEWKPEESRQ